MKIQIPISPEDAHELLKILATSESDHANRIYNNIGGVNIFREITVENLLADGFICIRKADKDNDLNGHWYKDGVGIIYQDFWNQDEFMWADRTKDGEFKSGFSLKYMSQIPHFK